MPSRKLTTTGSILGKNRKSHRNTNHNLSSDSNAKKAMSAEEYRKNKTKIDAALRSLRGRRILTDAEID